MYNNNNTDNTIKSVRT